MSLILEQAVRAAKPGMTNTPRTSKVWNYSPYYSTKSIRCIA